MKNHMRMAREAAGLSRPELADLSGVSDKTIATWESGRSFPSVFLASCVCDALGISVDEYIGHEPANGKVKSRYDLVVPLMAECDMNVTRVAERMGCNKNTVMYWIEKVRADTGLDPRKFNDLCELVKGKG